MQAIGASVLVKPIDPRDIGRSSIIHRAGPDAVLYSVGRIYSIAPEIEHADHIVQRRAEKAIPDDWREFSPGDTVIYIKQGAGIIELDKWGLVRVAYHWLIAKLEDGDEELEDEARESRDDAMNRGEPSVFRLQSADDTSNSNLILEE